jgi:hypothetical protein
MKKILLSLTALIGGVMPLGADVPAGFQEFRQGILNDFQDFRSTILEHYADFLDGTWHEYEPLMPLDKRDNPPKPIKVPSVKVSKPSTRPVTLPEPKLGTIPLTSRPALPYEPEEEPAEPSSPFDVPKTVIPPEALRETPPTLKVRPDVGTPVLGAIPQLPAIPLPYETIEPEPVVPEPIAETPVAPKPEVPEPEGEKVGFYGMEITVPEVDFSLMENMTKVSDLARSWRQLNDQEVASKVGEALKPTIDRLGLNDYLTFEFLCAYMDSKFPKSGISSRMSAVHYLLANMGYDARIGVATVTGDPLILLPSRQTIYGKSYLTFDGERYYVMNPGNVNLQGQGVSTCDLPKVASAGKRMDMLVKGLNLPVKPRKFDVNYGNLHLSGTLNENLMPVVYRYPQMETADFAMSELDPSLRTDLVRQVKEQLGGKGALEATNELLQFVQFGFDYATDNDFHGFEKPYFLEENLYYPKNDCEDRAIFYTYLLWHALGLENQLLFFPGHESASVALPGESVKGTGYMHEGKQFYVSDPTYVGSVTGMCMPQFETTAPKIDYTYPTNVK